VFARLQGYTVSIPAQGREHIIDGVLPVEELPQVDAGGVQAKPMTGIGVEENGPVVKLLPEHDKRVGYGFLTVLHGSILPFRSISPQTKQRPDIQQRPAIRVPRKAGEGLETSFP
jgi:hypothetical protein